MAAVMLAAAVLLLSGCVYVRFLELKHQFGDFDHNFSVSTDDGVKIVCQHPVLLSDDLRWLGLTPEHVRKLGHAEAWQVRWVKQLPPDVHESGAFDIVVEMFFADGKLTRIAIPERYFAVMSKQLLLDMLHSLGGSKVDRERRSVEAQLASVHPDLRGIEKLLGRPTAESDQNGETVRRYRYVPVATTRGARAAVFDLSVTFDDRTGDMLRWQGRTPVGTIGFTFTKNS